ncbi:MAG: Gfo/Idh/MocA family oxidoreductase [Phycisphaeraceae bacterium]|nr:Gfo/Idh/MocA family oxidoreductase [Phycisphaeraceae bacterium]
MRKVRVGLIGCGVIGRQHAAAAGRSECAEFAGVTDVRGEAAMEVARQHQAAKVYDSAAAMLADRNIDAVVLALPANLRCDLAVESLKAGKHVLLEKPVARNMAEVRRIQQAQGDRVVACCSCRFSGYASSRAAAQVVARGDLGRLRVVRFRGMGHDRGKPANNPPAWRVSHELNGGGIFVNWGCYDLDYIMGVTGWNLRPRLALAQCWGPAPHLPGRVAPGSDAETHAIALVLCDDGIVLSMERCEFGSLTAQTEWQIVGDRGSLRLDMVNAEGRQMILDQNHETEPMKSSVIWSQPENNADQHLHPLQDFTRAIATGDKPLTSLDRAAVMQKITDAVYESARTGQAVAID